MNISDKCHICTYLYEDEYFLNCSCCNNKICQDCVSDDFILDLYCSYYKHNLEEDSDYQDTIMSAWESTIYNDCVYKYVCDKCTKFIKSSGIIKKIKDENQKLQEQNNKLKTLLLSVKFNSDTLKSIYKYL
jgi:hypothetical protein